MACWDTRGARTIRLLIDMRAWRESCRMRANTTLLRRLNALYPRARWHQTLLRRGGDRERRGLHPRIRRRLPDLGAADTAFRAVAPLHHVQPARLSAVGHTERSCKLQPEP